ncbi:L-threonylcarbamoyladenylate synthase [Ferrimonas senticii]|uniref:L-threonylcarbamoyladenylate synthase n=1 Tax=Ferrimonas senticii TaxID=394566 RepID=UPI0004298AB9|nr:L-threonylcarbamoyladenylate synthase [Ferrimonas senticii]
MSQFFQVHPDNPQPRLISQAVALLRQGGVVVFPTDSGYALACPLGDKKALERICRIRQLNDDHNFSLICRDHSELAHYARVDNLAFRLLRNNTPGAYTFIFKGTKEVPRRLLNPKRKTIGIRIPDNNIAKALLEAMGEPLMSTSLILPGEQDSEADPYEIRERLEHAVDLIIDGGYLPSQPTTVVDLSDGDAQIVRVGCGDPSPFE